MLTNGLKYPRFSCTLYAEDTAILLTIDSIVICLTHVLNMWDIYLHKFGILNL